MNYQTLANEQTIKKVSEALAERGFEAILVKDRGEALEKIKMLIPEGASVMNGSSRTLEEIGFKEYFKSEEHKWNNLHAGILAEKDPAKQAALRKQSVISDYYLGSLHALSETGEIIIASNTGSQMPHLVFTSPNVILVAGTHKIVPTLEAGFQRLEEYVVPLENERMQEAYGVGTVHSKTLILHREPPKRRKILIILVNEKLGF